MVLTVTKQALILLALIATALLLLVIRPDNEPVLRVLAPSPVLVSRASISTLVPEEVVSGHLQPQRRAWLRFEVDGLVAERRAEPGQKVEAGEALLALESDDYQDALIQAEAAWRQSEQDQTRDLRLLELARRSRELQEQEVARLERLGERSLASKTRLGDAQALLTQRLAEETRLKAGVAMAPQRLAASRAALDRARRDLQRATLKAPFPGRVNQVQLEIGDFAGRNQPALELVSEQLEFYAQVRGEVARALSLGQQVVVDVDDERFPALVTSVQPDPDPATFTHAIRLHMPAQETRAGVFAKARLPLQALSEALVVPSTAVLLEGGHAYLFRVDEDVLRRVPVELGKRVGDKQVIRSGLGAGEQVVVRDVAALADGQSVVAEALESVEP